MLKGKRLLLLFALQLLLPLPPVRPFAPVEARSALPQLGAHLAENLIRQMQKSQAIHEQTPFPVVIRVNYDS
jgi:hypothetical protein